MANELIDAIINSRKAARARIVEIDKSLAGLAKEKKDLKALLSGGNVVSTAPAKKATATKATKQPAPVATASDAKPKAKPGPKPKAVASLSSPVAAAS